MYVKLSVPVQVLVKQLTMRGFLVGAHSSKRPEFLREMTGWIKEGKIEVLEHHTDGLDKILSRCSHITPSAAGKSPWCLSGTLQQAAPAGNEIWK